jgi:hypothetical protein
LYSLRRFAKKKDRTDKRPDHIHYNSINNMTLYGEFDGE